MKRREFVLTGCITWLAGCLSLSMLEGCGSTKTITGTIVGSDLMIPLADFEVKNGDRTEFMKYVIVQNNTLQYPICVYRFEENDYTAVWMRCTHQGTQLQAFGDKLECPAHGSKFDNRGEVIEGPAGDNLRVFPVMVEKHQLKVSLR